MPSRWLLLVGLSLALHVGCPGGRDLPPPPENEPKPPAAPACGKVFRDPKIRGIRGGSTCCVGPAAGLLKSGDILSACGLGAASYLGETHDGGACRFQFRSMGGPEAAKPSAPAPQQTYVMVSRVLVPPGAPAPTSPDAMLAWTWKKVPLRDAIGWKATSTNNEAGLLNHQTILWAGRGRRIVGLHVAKALCDEAQAVRLLQKAMDAVE